MRIKRIALWLLGVSSTLCTLYVYISRHIPQDDTVHEYLKRQFSGSFNPMSGKKMQDGQTKGETSRPEHCNGCFAPWLSYKAGQIHACGNDTRSSRRTRVDVAVVDVLVLVSSASGNRAQRQTIRETWGSASNNNTANVRIVFVIGQSYSAYINSEVNRESEDFRDVVQGNFKDSYEHLTFSTMVGVWYAVEMCSKARFLLKTDDDVWLNVPGLLNLLSRVDLTNQLGGHCYHGEYPRRFNQHSKWFTSYREFPRVVYPDYCAGVGYVMPMHVARGIYLISKDTPFFRMEDVFIGLCAEKMAYRVRQLPGFYAHRPNVDICEMKMNHVITSHAWNVAGMRRLWADVSDCSCPSYCKRMWLFLYSMVFVWISIVVGVFLHKRFENFSCRYRRK